MVCCRGGFAGVASNLLGSSRHLIHGRGNLITLGLLPLNTLFGFGHDLIQVSRGLVQCPGG